MDSTDSANAIFPIKLGPASAFNQTVFPLAYFEQKGNLNKGNYLIRATLEEMERIRQLGIDLSENQDFIFDTRVNLEGLRADKAKLQDNRKSFNPFKVFVNYRAARLFHAASRALYLQTKRTSEEIHRSVHVVPNTQLRIMDDAVPPEALLDGFSVDLPNGLDDDAKRIIKEVTQMMTKATKPTDDDPFDDNSIISQLRDDEQVMTLLSQDGCSAGADAGSSDLQQSHPTSPQTVHVNVNVIRNSIVATNSSNLSGFTHNQGDRHSGATVTQLAPKSN